METSTPVLSSASGSAATAQTINRYAIYAGAAGLIPVPVVDVAVVAVLQYDLLKQLSKHHHVNFDASKSRAWIIALSGSLLARIFSSIVKFIPFFGSVLSGGSRAITAAAATYALGRLVDDHFARGGTLENFDLRTSRSEFKQHQEEGVEMILKHQNEQETVEMKLQGLDQMYADGVITSEEYQTTKARILAAV
jgi:uncharacterized protein (DUF697 family)